MVGCQKGLSWVKYIPKCTNIWGQGGWSTAVNIHTTCKWIYGGRNMKIQLVTQVPSFLVSQLPSAWQTAPVAPAGSRYELAEGQVMVTKTKSIVSEEPKNMQYLPERIYQLHQMLHSAWTVSSLWRLSSPSGRTLNQHIFYEIMQYLYCKW